MYEYRRLRYTIVYIREDPPRELVVGILAKDFREDKIVKNLSIEGVLFKYANRKSFPFDTVSLECVIKLSTFTIAGSRC